MTYYQPYFWDSIHDLLSAMRYFGGRAVEFYYCDVDHVVIQYS